MEERLTEELLDELLSAPDPTAYLSEHEAEGRVLSDYLNELLGKKGLKRRTVVRHAHIDDTYGYLIFTGQRRHPSRDIVLQLAFAMGLTLRETDRLLQAAGSSRLYCKDRRDAIVIFCLDRGLSLEQTNQSLYDLNEPTLGS